MKKIQSFVSLVKIASNESKFKNVIEIVKEVSEGIVDYKKTRSSWSALKTISAVTLKLIEINRQDSYSYFGTEDWQPLFSSDFSSLILEMVSRYPSEDIISDDDGTVRVFYIKKMKVGCVIYDKKYNNASQFFVETKHEDEVEKIIKDAIWNKFKGKSILMKKNSVLQTTKSRESDTIVFEIDRFGKSLPSKLAEKWVKKLKKANELGYHRSLLFHGPPGTGKSTLARRIVDDLGYRSFRIRLTDISSMNASTIIDAIDIFKPDAVLIDDLDRAPQQDNLLETLEMFYDKLKLVIASANNTNKFDRATLRPGRFDEIEIVNNLDEEVIKSVLEEDNHDLFDLVKDWPIVFIEDLKKRIRIDGKDVAVKEIESLSNRVDELTSDDQDEDIWHSLKFLPQSTKKQKLSLPKKKRKKIKLVRD